MKILIIGGVAAGTKTAAKLKREDRNIDVTVITKDKDISYAGCGLPYYVGGLIEGRDELIVNTPQKYSALTGVEVRTGKEAVALDAEKKQVTVQDVQTGEKEVCSYDRLVVAVGASPAILPIEGKELACIRGVSEGYEMIVSVIFTVGFLFLLTIAVVAGVTT